MKIDENTILRCESGERIKKLEKYFHQTFPQDYVSFIKKYNGAVPITNVFDFDNNKKIVESFLCLIDREKYPDEYGKYGWYDIGVVESQISEMLCDEEDADSYGSKLIPIAALFAGDFLCLDYRENEKKPSVCIWYHDYSDDFSPCTKTVAGSFTEFLDMLYDNSSSDMEFSRETGGASASTVKSDEDSDDYDDYDDGL